MNNWGYVTESFLQMVQLLTNAVLHNCLFLVPAFMLAGLCVPWCGPCSRAGRW